MKLSNSLVYIFLILFSFIKSFPTKRRLQNTLTFDNSNWSYDESNNVYYQINVTYCQKPANITYETLGIYVPGQYMSCTNETSNYRCTINSSGLKGSYNAKNAPFVMPVNTSGYSAMKAPTSYDYNKVKSFIEKGIIYIYAGCRGKYEGSENSDSYYMGAPWGVTDLKAAIRFLRYNSALIPGDLNKFYTFGHSGGGAQSCLMGITGNSDLFKDYLNNIGAAMNLSNGTEIKDNIKGSQCWCPITNLDTADAAYEWNMGQYFNTSTRASGTFTKALSDDLVSEYFKYVNDIKLKDPKGNELTLTNTNEGTYYNYLKSVIEESLNNFLEDTTFPYTPSSSSSSGGPGGNSGEGPGGNSQGNGSFPGGSGAGPSGSGAAPSGSGNPTNTTTYQTKDEYINYLNSDVQWITKNNTSGNYSISSVGDFVTHCKSATKDVGAFDDLSKSQDENKLFGISYSTYAKHFDKIMATLLNNNSSTYSNLTNWNSSYPTEYNTDLSVNDTLNKSIEYRAKMYNPMYYIHPSYEGYNSSKVADYFRINTGITQGDTSNAVK